MKKLFVSGAISAIVVILATIWAATANEFPAWLTIVWLIPILLFAVFLMLKAYEKYEIVRKVDIWIGTHTRKLPIQYWMWLAIVVIYEITLFIPSFQWTPWKHWAGVPAATLLFAYLTTKVIRYWQDRSDSSKKSAKKALTTTFLAIAIAGCVAELLQSFWFYEGMRVWYILEDAGYVLGLITAFWVVVWLAYQATCKLTHKKCQQCGRPVIWKSAECPNCGEYQKEGLKIPYIKLGKIQLMDVIALLAFQLAAFAVWLQVPSYITDLTTEYSDQPYSIQLYLGVRTNDSLYVFSKEEIYKIDSLHYDCLDGGLTKRCYQTPNYGDQISILHGEEYFLETDEFTVLFHSADYGSSTTYWFSRPRDQQVISEWDKYLRQMWDKGYKPWSLWTTGTEYPAEMEWFMQRNNWAFTKSGSCSVENGMDPKCGLLEVAAYDNHKLLAIYADATFFEHYDEFPWCYKEIPNKKQSVANYAFSYMSYSLKHHGITAFPEPMWEYDSLEGDIAWVPSGGLLVTYTTKEQEFMSPSGVIPWSAFDDVEVTGYTACKIVTQ